MPAPIQHAPPWTHNYLAFPAEGRRERERERKSGVCLAAAGPDPLCGPLPFQTGNQPRVPASCRAVPHAPTPGPWSHTQPSGRPGPAAPPRLLSYGPQGLAYPNKAQEHRPYSRPPTSPPAPQRWLCAGSLSLSCWGGRMTKALHSLLTQRKPGTAGQGCEKSLCSGQPRGKGQKPGLESQAGGGCAAGRTTTLNPSQAGEGYRL